MELFRIGHELIRRIGDMGLPGGGAKLARDTAGKLVEDPETSDTPDGSEGYITYVPPDTSSVSDAGETINGTGAMRATLNTPTGIGNPSQPAPPPAELFARMSLSDIGNQAQMDAANEMGQHDQELHKNKSGVIDSLINRTSDLNASRQQIAKDTIEGSQLRQQEIDRKTELYNRNLADRGAFWKNPGNILSAFALSLSPLGGASVKDAVGMVNSAILRDFEARRGDADRDLTGLSSNLIGYRSIMGDKDAGDQLALANSYKDAALQIQSLSEKYQSASAKSQAKALVGDLMRRHQAAMIPVYQHIYAPINATPAQKKILDNTPGYKAPMGALGNDPNAPADTEDSGVAGRAISKFSGGSSVGPVEAAKQYVASSKGSTNKMPDASPGYTKNQSTYGNDWKYPTKNRSPEEFSRNITSVSDWNTKAGSPLDAASARTYDSGLKQFAAVTRQPYDVVLNQATKHLQTEITRAYRETKTPDQAKAYLAKRQDDADKMYAEFVKNLNDKDNGGYVRDLKTFTHMNDELNTLESQVGKERFNDLIGSLTPDLDNSWRNLSSHLKLTDGEMTAMEKLQQKLFAMKSGWMSSQIGGSQTRQELQNLTPVISADASASQWRSFIRMSADKLHSNVSTGINSMIEVNPFVYFKTKDFYRPRSGNAPISGQK